MTVPCSICGADDNDFFPLDRHRVRVDISFVRPDDLLREYDVFPAVSVVAFDAMVCSDCVCIARDTAEAFRRRRHELSGAPALAPARVLAGVWERLRRAWSVMLGGS